MNDQYEELNYNSSIVNDNLIEKVKKITQKYYNTHQKKLFFASNQKAACAQSVCSEIDLNELLINTVYIIKDTNIIFFNYLVFKTFANEEIFHIIIENLFEQINNCISNHGSFEMHFDLATFSVSAAERYKRLIELFVKQCLESKTTFVDSTINITIYNTPSVVETINKLFKALIHPALKTKIRYYDKKESPELLYSLLHTSSYVNNTKQSSY